MCIRDSVTDRQTTDGPSMTYSEHELEFTFAKNEKRGRWAWPITAELNGRANFGPLGPAGAAKKNGWTRAWPGPLKKNAPKENNGIGKLKR